MNLYLIKRSERPAHHNAPYHRVVLCARKDIAEWQAGDTTHQACMWVQYGEGEGWLWRKWEGLDLNYGGLTKELPLPNGERVAYCHKRDAEPWTLLSGAVWWSDRPMPAWWQKAGVIYPPDVFTRQTVLDDCAPNGTLSKHGSATGFPRPEPAFWPAPEPNEQWGARDWRRSA